ncbi:hypothetical protein KEM48_005955 [Puccinia striiformis f. sp. tritici PST-130]|nr:hypothetical protein KEM48_005955 [Puccinia striiformis f. sp. tritici PST-130]
MALTPRVDQKESTIGQRFPASSRRVEEGLESQKESLWSSVWQAVTPANPSAVHCGLPPSQPNPVAPIHSTKVLSAIKPAIHSPAH